MGIFGAQKVHLSQHGGRGRLPEEGQLFLSLNETMLRKCLASAWHYIYELY